MESLTTHTEIPNDARRAIIRLKKNYVSLYTQFVLRERDMPYPLTVGVKKELDEVVEKIHDAERALRAGREEELRLSITLGESSLLTVQVKIMQRA